MRDGDDLVGACGLFCADVRTAEWVNGPVALRDRATVLDALLAVFDVLLALVHVARSHAPGGGVAPAY